MRNDEIKDKYAILRKTVTVAIAADIIQREYEGKGDFDDDWDNLNE